MSPSNPLPDHSARVEPDALHLFVRNLKPGMYVVDEGPVHDVEEHSPGWFNLTYDRPGRTGEGRRCYSTAGTVLKLVLTDSLTPDETRQS